MERRRLLVVVPIPEPVSVRIDGVRIMLGDQVDGRIGPHITLVPPVNVREDALDEALASLRDLATHSPVTTAVGPIETFAPANPVLYLDVAERDALRRLRDEVFTPPLSRPLSHTFVPHITVRRSASEAQIREVPKLTQFSDLVTLDRVELLEQQRPGPKTTWVPIADVLLGSAMIAGRGGIETTLTSSTLRGPQSAEDSLPMVGADLVLTASRLGEVVGRCGAMADDGSLIVIAIEVDEEHVGTGIGRALMTRARDIAVERELDLRVSEPLRGAIPGFVGSLGL